MRRDYCLYTSLAPLTTVSHVFPPRVSNRNRFPFWECCYVGGQRFTFANQNRYDTDFDGYNGPDNTNRLTLTPIGEAINSPLDKALQQTTGGPAYPIKAQDTNDRPATVKAAARLYAGGQSIQKRTPASCAENG